MTIDEIPNAERRFCKDCKWAQPRMGFLHGLFGDRWEFARCARPGALDLVGAGARAYCSIEREYETSQTCGPKGKYYDPRRND